MKSLFIPLSVGILCLAICCKNSTVGTVSGAAPKSTPHLFSHEKKMTGLTMVAPPKPFPDDPMPPIQAVGAGWIAVVPYAFTPPGQAEVRYAVKKWQWWGESPEGAAETIRRARKAGIQVMLKPQVYIPNGWTGAMDFQSEAEWAQWEAGYKTYILHFAHIADTTGAELFCIGTEFNNAITKRPDYWKTLIKEIKQVYHGKLIYSSNWDDWDRVPFWADLDYIGLGGYFPLVEAETPTVENLIAAWAPIKERLRQFSEKQQRKVVFTEFGYLSVNNCGWRNWELEQGITSRPINEQAQANCYEALFSTFFPESWWAGSFLWKWFPNGQGHEGYPERDYTPQGKIGEKVVQKWYSQGSK